MFTTVLSFMVSIAVTYVFFRIQKGHYDENKYKLEKARNFFLANSTYSVKSDEEENLIDDAGVQGDLKNLIKELNLYMARNKGTTDFSIIQNKTERYANTIYENASSNLSLPSYYGLMGTFIGVFMGLCGFVMTDVLNWIGMDIATDEESNVTRLIIGVIVSMVTSFIGLYLTTQSNKAATECKRIMDERKNMFYDFIQNELMPVLGMSVVAALSQLKETLLHFHESFDVITDKFERTFNGCTDRFGKAFEKNIVAVGKAAEQLGGSIDTVNKNIENQKALLKELRSDGMIAALDLFVEAGKEFGKSVAVVKDLNRVHNELSTALKSLMSTQEEYNKSLIVPKLIAERLNVILERVTTFENSVNVLGESLAQTQMLGNSEMNLIQKHLENIKRKDEIAAEYQETANEELQLLFDGEVQQLKDLHFKFSSAIEQHQEEFLSLMEQVSAGIVQKKEEFMQTLQDAFDTTQLNMDFAHLRMLPDIKKGLDTIQAIVDAFNTSVKEQGYVGINKLGMVKNALDAIPPAIEKQSRLLDEGVNAVAARMEPMERTLGNVNERTESVAKQASELSDNINALAMRLTSLKNDVESKSADDVAGFQHINNVIDLQQNQLLALGQILERSKKELNDNLAEMVRSKVQGLEKRIRDLDSQIKALPKKL